LEETLKLLGFKYVVGRRSLPDLRGIFSLFKKDEKEKMGQVEGVYGRTYLKAMPLRDLSDLDVIKSEVNSGNVLILRITSLAKKNIEDVKRAVNELIEFADSIEGDIARLGEERVVICPPNVKIWRQKTPVSNEAVPTAA
jgi:hypothetical protein